MTTPQGGEDEADVTDFTRNTYELICDEFICEPHGTVVVKGKGDMETWYLVGQRVRYPEATESAEPVAAMTANSRAGQEPAIRPHTLVSQPIVWTWRGIHVSSPADVDADITRVPVLIEWRRGPTEDLD